MVEKKKAIEILEELRTRLKSLPPDIYDGGFITWKRNARIAVQKIFPDSEEHFRSLTEIMFRPSNALDLLDKELTEPIFNSGVVEADALLQSMVEEVRHFWKDEETTNNSQDERLPAKGDNSESPPTIDSRTVFVVHGRNEAARKSMFEFLWSIGLSPLEWSQAVAATGKGSPYVGEILDAAFLKGQAVVVLMTPDDDAVLKKEFQTRHDEPYETQSTGQARPNVLFEAGMAMGRNADRTVLVQIGNLRPFSDVGGRHILRLTNTSERRQELAERLKTAGCPVNLSGTVWHSAGSFDLESLGILNPPNRATTGPATSLESNPVPSPAGLMPSEAETIQSSKDGWINIVDSADHGRFVWGFVSEDDPSYQAIYLDAIESLFAKGLVRLEGKDSYRLTGRGFEILKTLKSTTEGRKE